MMGRIGSVLGQPEQIERDRQAVRIFNSDVVQRAKRELAAVYERDPAAEHPDARSTIESAAAATAMAQAVAIVNKDTDRPFAYWSVTAPHDWGDVHVPLAGLMIDDPDNIYRGFAVDGAAGYEIIGKVLGEGPAQETYVLHEEHTGVKKDQEIRSNQKEAGAVSLHDLSLAPDGGFTITIDNSPVNGRVNHIQTNPEVRDGYIIIRSTLADWVRNDPSQLEIRRVAGPPVQPPETDAALAAKAAELIGNVGAYWLAWCRRLFYDRPVNTVTHSFARVSGWGHISCGHYRIAPDEALVVHLERRDAVYLGFQLSDTWGQGQDTPYIERTGSLNGSQAVPNSDGSYSFVIAVTDPGVYNWLDAIGSHAGTFAIRWQGLPDGVGAGDAVKSMSVVRLQDLKAKLPAETRWCTPEQRAEQLQERIKTFQRRLNL